MAYPKHPERSPHLEILGASGLFLILLVLSIEFNQGPCQKGPWAVDSDNYKAQSGGLLIGLVLVSTFLEGQKIVA